jgi:protease-4
MVIVLTMAIAGCAFVDMNLAPQLQPYQEKVFEGKGRPKIVIIDINGFISEKDKAGGQLSKGKSSTVTEVKESLQKAEADNDVAGIILRINTPGGSVSASDIIHHEILRFKERKNVPVYSCITGMGTSGGYYIAAATDRIYAHPAAITGSIGVILMKFNVEGLLGKIGVQETTFKSGGMKDILSPFRPSTPQEEKLIQELVNQLQGRFLQVVQQRKGNQLSRPQLEAIADGRVFTASQALDAKLIDNIAYLDEVIEEVKKSKNLKEARIVGYFRPGNYKGTIYSGSPDDSSVLGMLGLTSLEAEMPAGYDFYYLWRQ